MRELTFVEAMRVATGEAVRILGMAEQFNERLGPGANGERAIRYFLDDSGEVRVQMDPQVAAVIRDMGL